MHFYFFMGSTIVVLFCRSYKKNVTSRGARADNIILLLSIVCTASHLFPLRLRPTTLSISIAQFNNLIESLLSVNSIPYCHQLFFFCIFSSDTLPLLQPLPILIHPPLCTQKLRSFGRRQQQSPASSFLAQQTQSGSCCCC